MAPDITEGKLVSKGNLGDRQRANQEIAPAQDQGSPTFKLEMGLGQREIARACSLRRGAVHNYLKRAAETGMQWPLPEGWDEKRIEEAVFGKQCSIEESSRRAFPGFPALHQQLQQHPHLTLQSAWVEYREKNPEGYRYGGESALSVRTQDLRITE